jgi:hypothetical protein
MGGLGYFLWLAGQALIAGPVLLPVPTLLAATGLVVALAGARGNPELRRPRSLWLLLPFAVPVAILAYGVVFAYDGPVWSAPPWRRAVVAGLIGAHLPLAALLLWRLRGIRLVVLGVSAIQLWLSLCAGFMAVMSVTNVWL